MIRFDQEAPAGGLDVYVQLKNGKAEITFVMYLKEAEAGPEHPAGQQAKAGQERPTGQQADGIALINIKMFNENGEEAARVCLKVEAAVAERPLTTRTLLIYPHLWNSTDAPHLYEIKATITEEHQISDTIEILCPICHMSNVLQKGFFLNEKPFTLHAVRYHVEQNWFQYLEEDLKLLRELGANCICPDHLPQERSFYAECLERGIIVWKLTGDAENLPVFCGEEKALLRPDRSRREAFYLYKACWSRQSVLYICNPWKTPDRSLAFGGIHVSEESAVSGAGVIPETVATSCTISVTVYSNRKRIALYVNGILHEFKESAPIFRFEDVPVKGEHTVISAQAGDMYYSLTL